MDKKELAVSLFCDGFNCSQSVCAAFSEDFGISKDIALRMSEGLGGGVGRMREMCGAVTGMAMVLSLKYGSGENNDKEARAQLYAKIQKACDEFKDHNGSLFCRDLIGKVRSIPVPDERTAEYYKKRPCAALVADAAEIIENIFENE